jgi:hypothetical protein
VQVPAPGHLFTAYARSASGCVRTDCGWQLEGGQLIVHDAGRSLNPAGKPVAAPHKPDAAGVHRPQIVADVLPAQDGTAAAPIGRWCAEHDERNSFVFTYITLSVLLSVMAGLFWLVLLVGVHFGLELYRNRNLERRSRLAHATFGIKLDVTLILLALALTLYMDLLFAALGLRALPRAGAAVGRVSGRLGSIRRIVRAALMVTDEVVRIAAYFAAARGITAPAGGASVWRPHSPWTERWSTGTRLVIGLGVAALILLFAAPWLTDYGIDGTLAVLAHELSPFTR